MLLETTINITELLTIFAKQTSEKYLRQVEMVGFDFHGVASATIYPTSLI